MHTKETLISAMRSLACRLDKSTLSKRDMEADPASPSAMTVIRFFGSWGDALKAAELQEGKRGRPINHKEMFDTSITYNDNHVFFNKQEIWGFHQARGQEWIFANLVLPFKSFLRSYMEIYGWIYPPQPTIDQMRSIFDSLRMVIPKANTSNTIGSLELKGWFRSFWHANVKGSPPPTDALKCDKIVDRLLKYRFGISNSKSYRYKFDGQEVESQELFDISFKQVRRALEVNRYSVSLFKPLLAKWLYERYAMAGSVVWDPCSGFGGRMFGALSANCGRYVACDPNSRTMGELLLLADGLGIADNVSLHVSSMENMTMDAESVDLVLTSPPYFDKEHYCDEVGQSDMMYKSRQGWIDGFLTILGRRAATALKSSGKYVLIVDADLIVPAIETAKGAGFLQLEQLPLLNAKTHLTGKKSMECVLAFQRP